MAVSHQQEHCLQLKSWIHQERSSSVFHVALKAAKLDAFRFCGSQGKAKSICWSSCTVAKQPLSRMGQQSSSVRYKSIHCQSNAPIRLWPDENVLGRVEVLF